MKKTQIDAKAKSRRKLVLSRGTIATLTARDLATVAGGLPTTITQGCSMPPYCFLCTFDDCL